jgi:hypothetical protein
MSVNLGKIFGASFGITRKLRKLWLWQMMPILAFIFLLPPIYFYYSAFKQYAMDIELAFPIEPETRIIFEIGNYLFVLSFFLLFILAQVITIHVVNEIENGASTVSFTGVLRKSFLYYFRIVKLYFLFIGSWTIIFLVLQYISFSVFKINRENYYYFYPISLLLFPVGLISVSAMQLTQTTIIVNNVNFLKAVSRGWKLLLANKWEAILMMTILYFFSSLPSIILIAPLFIGTPIFFLYVTRLSNLDVILAIIFFIGIPFVIFIFMMSIGITMTFFQTTWTIFYLRITSPDKETEIINE